MTELPKKAILQPRELGADMTWREVAIIVALFVGLPFLCLFLGRCIDRQAPPKTYEDCKSVSEQEEFLRNELHQFLEKELSK